MTIVGVVSHASIYTAAGHFMFYLLVTAHVCLFVDLSPWQKYPLSKLNYLIASVLAAAIPSVITSFATISSSSIELGVGLVSAFTLSIFITLSLQQIINLDYDF